MKVSILVSFSVLMVALFKAGSIAAQQSGVVMATPVPTPLPPGMKPPGISSATVSPNFTNGASNNGPVAAPAPRPVLIVGGESIYVPNRDCFYLIRHALDTHTPSEVSDPACAKAMSEALEIQRTRPEPTQ